MSIIKEIHVPDIGDFKNADVIEANEAFAAQACAVAKDLGFPADKVNPNGSGISLDVYKRQGQDQVAFRHLVARLDLDLPDHAKQRRGHFLSLIHI